MEAPETGVLLINLGTPDAPSPKALRRYLAEFLADPRVVELPRWLWKPILYSIILQIRPRYSAKLYQKIWTENGSPLLIFSQQLANGLQTFFNQLNQKKIKVTLGMCYGAPSIAQALKELQKANVKKILVFPLYPQYSAATVGSAFDAVAKVLNTWRYIPELQMVSHYSHELSYIDTLTEHIKSYWQNHRPGESLLFSFHGLPKQSIALGDPYYSMCQQTANQIAERLGLTPERWLLVFQSRFGRKEWLQPYCDKTLQELAQKGYKSVDVVCPGFAVDCLETLEEIAQRNREIFIEAGGQDLNYIDALNASSRHLQMLASIIQDRLKLSNY